MIEDVAAFGLQLAACRGSAGLSQEELAARSGLSVRTVSNLERGRTRRPHPDSVRRLADALQLRGEARWQFVAAAGRPPPGAGATGFPDHAGNHRLGAASAPIVPRQLPAPVPQFVGRRAELAALTALLGAGTGREQAVVISAIGGTAGVGKTALAVHWAHQVAGRFPDGQLYVNLRGYDPDRPLPTADALAGFLRDLGLPAQEVPAEAGERAGRYRSLLAGRRVLIVLDNARDAGQVRPLLPGSRGCLVLVTSRSQLTGLAAAEGARRLTLDLLTEAEARELLAARLGAARLDVEPDAAAELTGLCTRLPLALAIAAARAQERPALGLGVLAEELRDARRRLDALDTGDPAASVRAVFSWSRDTLPAPAVRMFALLGLHPGPDITIPAAASLAGIPLPRARRALRELADAHLATEHAAGRFSLHDLLRAYAAEQAAGHEPQSERDAAIERVLDHYLHTANTAALLLNQAREPVVLDSPGRGVAPEPLAGYQQAMAWFEAEHQVLLGVLTLAIETGSDACAWRLSWAMADFLDRRGHWHQWAAIQRTALAAATRLGDMAGQAGAHRLLANACACVGDYDEAHLHLTEGLTLYRQLSDPLGQARAHQSLGSLAEGRGRPAEALGHDEQALALYRAIGSRAGEADALNNVGWCHALLGDYQQARAFCQQAVTLHRQTGARAGLAHAWDSLGYIEHKVGNLSDGAECYSRALDIFRDLGDRYEQAQILTHLGDVRHTSGDQPAARDAWQQALDTLDGLGHPDAATLRAKLHRNYRRSAMLSQT